MSAERRIRQQAERDNRRREATEKRAQAAAAAAATAEARDEAIVPSAQRRAVLAPGGDGVMRAPRVQREGVTFVTSNPIAHLVKRGIARAERGELPTITPAHERACKRLAHAWEEGGRGVGMGASDWGRQGGHDGAVPQGIAEDVLARIGYQNQQKALFEGAMTWLGGLGGVVGRVVLDGADLTVWAREKGIHRNAAPGYLAAALDRLLEYFAAVDLARERPARAVPIRAAEIVGRDAK